MPLGTNDTVNFSSKKLLALLTPPNSGTGTPEEVKVNLEIRVLSISFHQK